MLSIPRPRRLGLPFFSGASRLRALLAACLAFVLSGIAAAPAASALTVLPRDFETLVAQAETVFKGTVVGQESAWTGEGQNRHIVTRVTFQVLETYKGVAASSQTLEFLGGTVDGQTLLVPGMPRFSIGETAVLFAVGNGQQICPLVGAYQGRFQVRRDPATAREQIYTHDGRPVTDTARIGAEAATTDRTGSSTQAAAAAQPPMLAETFRERIAETLRDRRARSLPEVARED